MIFVTGATGFVGEALVQKLLQENQMVRVGVRNDSTGARKDGVATSVVGSLGQDSLDSLDLHGVSIVVHCAGRAHVMRERETSPMEAFRQVNVKGTLDLAKRAAACGVRRFVFISSVKVHGENSLEGQAFRAEDILHPQDPYGVSKLEAEKGLQALAVSTGMEVVIVRPPLVYGPGVKANFAALLRWCRLGWPLPLGSVRNKRSLVSLDNLTDFILVCCHHPAAANQAFLVSDGQDVSTPQLLRTMAQACGGKTILLPVPVWILHLFATLIGKSASVARLCGNLQVDIQKNQQLLGWRPKGSLEEGLRRAVLEQRAA